MKTAKIEGTGIASPSKLIRDENAELMAKMDRYHAAAAPVSELKEGATVWHAAYGKGMIVWANMENPGVVKVDFGSHTKKLLTKYADLCTSKIA